MNLIAITLGIVFLLILSFQIDSSPVSDYKYVLEYLEAFGYLTKESKIELSALGGETISKRKSFIRALKDFQVSKIC